MDNTDVVLTGTFAAMLLAAAAFIMAGLAARKELRRQVAAAREALAAAGLADLEALAGALRAQDTEPAAVATAADGAAQLVEHYRAYQRAARERDATGGVSREGMKHVQRRR